MSKKQPLTLRLSSTTNKISKPTRRKQEAVHRSWVGHEKQRERLRVVAQLALEADAVAERVSQERGWSTAGAIMEAMRSPACAAAPEIAVAASAYAALRDVQSELIWQEQIAYQLVLAESRAILDSRNAAVHLARAQRLVGGDGTHP